MIISKVKCQYCDSTFKFLNARFHNHFKLKHPDLDVCIKVLEYEKEL